MDEEQMNELDALLAYWYVQQLQLTDAIASTHALAIEARSRDVAKARQDIINFIDNFYLK